MYHGCPCVFVYKVKGEKLTCEDNICNRNDEGLISFVLLSESS